MYNYYHGYPDQLDTDRQNPSEVKEMCQTNHYYFVQIQLSDGSLVDGIIDGTDEDHVYMLVPVGDEMGEADQRQFGYSGYGGFGGYGGYGGYPFGGGYGYPRRFRRFRRRRFPFFHVRRLFFPFFY
ncbi:hypothetical protein SAMN05421743_11910 [Thalassobacillus cyri]|uniref:Uncharacterized protein n=1 Tax=Thalassobacillus cyri TaxID=571932 RepID=A0A1H4GVE9_9BACI|nr:hypothetical protein [Thalassobacillus cyri]SEB13515.1 hypothetical protein SAMN05421743_11910 [Thalassobacillus cyri]